MLSVVTFKHRFTFLRSNLRIRKLCILLLWPGHFQGPDFAWLSEPVIFRKFIKKQCFNSIHTVEFYTKYGEHVENISVSNHDKLQG